MTPAELDHLRYDRDFFARLIANAYVDGREPRTADVQSYVKLHSEVAAAVFAPRTAA